VSKSRWIRGLETPSLGFPVLTVKPDYSGLTGIPGETQISTAAMPSTVVKFDPQWNNTLQTRSGLLQIMGTASSRLIVQLATGSNPAWQLNLVLNGTVSIINDSNRIQTFLFNSVTPQLGFDAQLLPISNSTWTSASTGAQFLYPGRFEFFWDLGSGQTRKLTEIACFGIRIKN
jgi:hypothetical protein